MGVNVTLRRCALLGYSVAPGVAKLSGSSAMFSVGLLLLALYLALLPGSQTAARRLQGVRLGLLAFAGYAVLLGVLMWWLGMLRPWTMAVGGLNFVLPLVLVALAGADRGEALLGDLPWVAALHAVLALLVYPPWRPDWAWLQGWSDTLLEGTLAFRLASVSGSLALSSVMVTAFALALRQHFGAAAGSARSRLAWLASGLFMLCAFLSLQRAAWAASCIVLVAALLEAPRGRRRSVTALALAALAPWAAAAVWIELPDDGMAVVADRFDSLVAGAEAGAVAERSDQWVHAGHNLARLPLGYGPGQLGQAARDSQPLEGGQPVYDGDYFRIASEYGVIGIALVALVGASLLAALMKVFGSRERFPGDRFAAAAAIGLMLQGIGTNITELYFANTLFWTLLLLQWRAPDTNAEGRRVAARACAA